jgi:putative ABC transport system ATP-binding protein
VTVAGVDVVACSRAQRARLRRRRIGFVFQFFELIPGLSVAENVGLPLALDGRPDTDRRVADLLAAVGLADLADRLPGELSGGQMQRVAVARALVADPVLVLADEPTGNLDSSTAAQVLDLLATQARQRAAALVVATHDPAAVARMDRVVTVRDGRLHAAGPAVAASTLAHP